MGRNDAGEEAALSSRRCSRLLLRIIVFSKENRSGGCYNQILGETETEREEQRWSWSRVVASSRAPGEIPSPAESQGRRWSRKQPQPCLPGSGGIKNPSVPVWAGFCARGWAWRWREGFGQRDTRGHADTVTHSQGHAAVPCPFPTAGQQCPGGSATPAVPAVSFTLLPVPPLPRPHCSRLFLWELGRKTRLAAAARCGASLSPCHPVTAPARGTSGHVGTPPHSPWPWGCPWQPAGHRWPSAAGWVPMVGWGPPQGWMVHKGWILCFPWEF